jgi:AcrR family transcriptional regulator
MNSKKGSILQKSREIFERHGYQKTTLTDIARSVGKVKTAIYYYFSGKEEIFAELVRYEAEGFYKQLQTVVDKQTSALAKLECYVQTRVQLMQKISGRYHFLKQEFFELIPIVEENRKEYYVLELRMVEEILHAGVANNEFMAASPQFGAEMLVNSLKGLEIQMFVTDEMVIEEANYEAFTHFMLHGLIQSK